MLSFTKLMIQNLCEFLKVVQVNLKQERKNVQGEMIALKNLIFMNKS